MPAENDLIRQQRRTDSNYLRALAISHYVLAALAAAIAAYAAYGQIQMHRFEAKMDQRSFGTLEQMHSKTSPEASEYARKASEMQKDSRTRISQLDSSMGLMTSLIVAVYTLSCVLNALSGWCMARRKAWAFSLVVAGINLVSVLLMPLNAVLAVFTLIVLLRGSVGELYGRGTA